MNASIRTEPKLQALPGDEPAASQVVDSTTPARPAGRSGMRWLVASIGVIAIAAIVAIVWRQQAEDVAPVSAPPAPRADADKRSEPRYPIEAVAAKLPPLDSSDAALLAALQTVFAHGGGLASLVEPRDLVRNFVATVDNLPRKTIARERVPLKPPVGAFGVARAGEATVMTSANTLRYRPYVTLLESADMTKLVQLYVSHYPLFQQAYRDLGYPDGHFNDRFVEALDVVLATPEHRGEIRLVQPKIFHQFAERDLEALPAGQKLMLRIGSDNAARVKKRLVELRGLVTAQAPAR